MQDSETLDVKTFKHLNKRSIEESIVNAKLSNKSLIGNSQTYNNQISGWLDNGA